MSSVSYWPLQFSASMLEGDALNLGVVVASESGKPLRWKIQPDAHRRVDRAFRGQDLKKVASLQLAYVEAELGRMLDRWGGDTAQLVSHVDTWAARLANQTRLGARAEMRVVAGLDPLDHLFALLVHDTPAATDARVPTDRLLWQRFTKEGLHRYVTRPGVMSVPVAGQDFTHDFAAAYQNGRMNYVQAEHLPGRRDRKLGPRVAWLRELAQSLHTNPPEGHPSALVVVASAEDAESIDALRDCVADFDADVHDIDDLDVLVEDVRKAKAQHTLV